MTTNTLHLYACHKTVSAARIERVTDAHALQGGGAMLKLAGIEHPRHVSPEFVAKHDPVAGGYFVAYADGYESFSPAAEFEGGYSPVEAPAGMAGFELFKAVVLPMLKAAQDLAVLHGMPVVSIVGVEPNAEMGVGSFIPNAGKAPPMLLTAVRLLQLMQADPDSAWALVNMINSHPAFSESAPATAAMH